MRARRWLGPALATLGLMLTLARGTFILLTSTLNFAGATLGSELVYSLAPVGALVVGSLITFHRSTLSVGWWWLATGLAAAALAAAQQYAAYALVVAPGAVPGGVLAHQVAEVAFPTLFVSAVAAMLFFPDGRLPSPRWRWLPWFMGVCWVLALPGQFAPGASGMVEGIRRPLVIPGFGWYEAVAVATVLGLFLVATPATLVAVIVRYRRSRGRERAQIKWFALGGSILAGSVALEIPLVMIGASLEGLLDALVEAAAITAPPVAVGIAVLRHDLYAIDRIVSRTVGWAVLTGLLAAVYLVLVIVLQRVLAPLTGESDLAVAGATLAVAALFAPARRSIQGAVDRRFDRARYDAERTVAGFRARLRDDVDLDGLGRDLLTTVGATVQPERVGLWLMRRRP